MEDHVIKLKRQVRDWYNKKVEDEVTIKEVAKTIGYNPPTNEEDSSNAVHGPV